MGNSLDAAQIQALLASQKSRGEYDAELRDFLASGEAGIEVDLQGGPLSGKRAKMVKVGFDNARKKKNEDGSAKHAGGDKVRVIAVNAEAQTDDHIYLINTALATNDATSTEEAA